MSVLSEQLARAPAQAHRPAVSRRVAADLVGFVDMLTIFAGIAIPTYLFGDTNVRSIEVMRSGLIAAIIAYGCLRNWRLYDTQDMRCFPVRPEKLVVAAALAMVAVLGLAAPIGDMDDATHIAWSWAWFTCAAALLVANRVLARFVLRSAARAGYFDERIAVYGAGPIALRLQEYLAGRPGDRRLIGVFDDRLDQDRRGSQVVVAGTLADLISLGRDGGIDRIIVAMPQSADRRLAQIVRKLEQLPVSIHAVTHFSGDLIDSSPAHNVSNLGPVGLLDIKRKPLADWAPFIKRAEDLVLGGIVALATLPLMLLIAIIVRLDSPGPILFRQRRRGLNQRVITIVKFRTMTVLEDGADVRQARSNDTRTTRVGRFLRRSSLDELPQLYNVLIGEMSLVGPRPHALVHDDQWGEMLERYANRHQVKPGITGLAQVKGFRGEARCEQDIRDRVNADLEYIANWSLWLDLRILAGTVLTVLGARNAY